MSNVSLLKDEKKFNSVDPGANLYNRPYSRSFIIKGKPIPRKSVRETRGNIWYDPQKKLKKPIIAELIWQFCKDSSAPVKQFHGPLEMNVVFYQPIPKSRIKDVDEGDFCDKKPDVSNLLKFIEDVITNSEIWGDDCQVAKASQLHIYSHAPRTEFTITEL